MSTDRPGDYESSDATPAPNAAEREAAHQHILDVYVASMGVGIEFAREVLGRTPPGLVRKLDAPSEGPGVRIDTTYSMLELAGSRFLLARLLHTDGDRTYSFGGPTLDDGGRLSWSGVVPMENGAGVVVRFGIPLHGTSRDPELSLDLTVPECCEVGDPLHARVDPSARTIIAIADSDVLSIPGRWYQCEPDWAAEQIERLSTYNVVYPPAVDRSRRANWSRIN